MTSRRRFLGLVGATAGGAVAGTAVTLAADQSPADAIEVLNYSPYGAHQAGVASRPARTTEVLAFDLLHPEDASALARLMRLWSGDVEALMHGRPAPGDAAPDLAQAGVGLTITVGLGPGAFSAPELSARKPSWLEQIPPMQHDQLEEQWSGGDAVIVIAASDGTTVAHVSRRMVTDAMPFARLRWMQSGSWNPHDAHGRPVTGRNLFGQVDGSGNSRPGTPAYDATVWSTSPPWMAGGTSLVVRRIRMDLDEWDTLTRFEQERAVGRSLDEGSWLSGGGELDQPDFDLSRDGHPAIPVDAHARLSHPTQNGGRAIVRKGANYVVASGEGMSGPLSGPESGLVFLAFQADPVEQFVPLQQRLDMADALNTWTTAIGSAVFAVLPGFGAGGWLGQPLLDQL